MTGDSSSLTVRYMSDALVAGVTIWVSMFVRVGVGGWVREWLCVGITFLYVLNVLFLT